MSLLISKMKESVSRASQLTFNFDLTGIGILFIIKDIDIKKCFDEEEYIKKVPKERVFTG